MTSFDIIQWCCTAKFAMQMSGEKDRETTLNKTKPDDCTPLDYHIACLIAMFAWNDLRDWAQEAGIDVELFGLEKPDEGRIFRNT